MQQGYISLHRCIQDNKLWKLKPYDKARAWIDLLLLANFKDNEFLLGIETVNVLAGSFITSETKLMARWGWSKTKLRSYLKMLEGDSMIEKRSDSKKTTITIVNYKAYQDSENHKKTKEKPEKDTNNKEKNEKKKDIVNKIAFAEFVSMTQPEFNKLLEAYGTANVTKMIEVLDNYKGSNNKKYASDYRAILNWVKDKVLKEAPAPVKQHKANPIKTEF